MEQRNLEQVRADTLRGLGAEIRLGGNVYARGGFEITLVWLPGGKNTSPGWELWTQLPLAAALAGRPVEGPYRAEARPPLPSPAPVCFRRERWLDRLGKTLRISREAQTGDAAFDARVYIESDAPEGELRAFLADPGGREGILSVLAAEQAKVELKTDGRLSVSMRSASLSDFDRPRIEEMSASLARVAGTLPPLVAVRRSVWTPAVIFVALVVAGSIASWPAFLLFKWLYPPVDDDPYTTGALAGFALWLVSLPVLVLTLRGRSTSLRRVIACVVCLVFGLPLGVISGLLGVNGGLDGSAVVSRAATVTHRRAVAGKSPSYHVTLRAAWGGGAAADKEVDVSYESYASLREGGRATVKTHAGALGWEWIVSIRAER